MKSLFLGAPGPSGPSTGLLITHQPLDRWTLITGYGLPSYAWLVPHPPLICNRKRLQTCIRTRRSMGLVCLRRIIELCLAVKPPIIPRFSYLVLTSFGIGCRVSVYVVYQKNRYLICIMKIRKRATLLLKKSVVGLLVINHFLKLNRNLVDSL